MKLSFKGKLNIALATFAGVLLSGGVIIMLSTRTLDLDGPTSPEGYRVKVRVSARHFAPDSACYVDILLIDLLGHQTVIRHASRGEYTVKTAKEIVRLIRWTPHGDLEFPCFDGQTGVFWMPHLQRS